MQGIALRTEDCINTFFQTVGTLFSYNLGLPIQLAAYEDVKLTIATRHLLLYVFGVSYTRHIKSLRVALTTFPTFVPFRLTLGFGSKVAKLLVRLSIFKRLISRYDVVHLNDREYPYTKAAAKLKKKTVLTLHWFPSKIDEDVITNVDEVVAPSKNASKVTQENLGILPKVIYHGVDDSLFNVHTISKREAREHLERAVAYRDQGKYRLAERQLNKAIKLAPDWAWLYQNLCEVGR